MTAAFYTDLASLRGQVAAALDRSIGRCARCKICDNQVNAAMSAIGTEFDRLHAALEHAASAAAGSHEGIRLWMLDCGELVAKHRTRADAAEKTAEGLLGMAMAETSDETSDERAPRIVSFDLMPQEPDFYFVLTEALGEFAARHRGEAEDEADPRMSIRLAETAEKALDLIEKAMTRGGENLHGKPE